MRLSLRLALPFFVVAAAVTLLGIGGVVWLVQRTFDASLAQEGRQLGRITENALQAEARPLADAAAVLAFVDGNIARRLAAWRKVELDAAGVVRRDTGAVVSWTGDEVDPADLAGLIRVWPGVSTSGETPGVASTPVLLRARGHLLLAGLAPDRDGRHMIVAARRLGAAFAASLRSLLQAEITLTEDGRPVAGLSAHADVALVPVTHLLRTPGGGRVALTMHLPGEGVRAARRRAIGLTLAGGGALLAVGIAFYLYLLARVTRPLDELIAACDRIAAGDLGAALPPNAPAELGDLIAKFNAMGTALREAQDRLVRSAKLTSVGALVAGVSHELNNPLSVLLTHAEYQATQIPAGAPGREELDVVREQGRRMQKILADLRGLVRPGAETPGPVDLNAVAREALALVRHDATKAHVACEAVLAPGAVVVTASADDLRQIALNLAINALQAMPEGGRLVIRTGRASVNGRAIIHLSVQDTGAGIAAGDLARVTEPFFSTKPGRLGLGLAISQDLARRHGGTLVIDSAPGRGTTATLEFAA
ncbi:MAG: ATP-binding protein [Candidatus Coatesbacteria bacterium]